MWERKWERSANYDERTFSCYRAKQKCNFSSSSVRWIHDKRRIAANNVWVVFLDKKKKRNAVGEFAKKMFETVLDIVPELVW